MDAQNLNVLQGRQILGPILTPLLPFPLPLPTKRPDTSSSSASSTASSSSTSVPASSTSTSSSSSSSSIPTPSSTSSSASLVQTVVQGQTRTVTATAAADTSTSSAIAAPKSFLQNKVLSGVVFALAGLVGLVIIIVVATLAIRRSRRKKLLDDAMSFDPVKMGTNYDDHLENGNMEKSRVSSSTGHGSNGPEIVHSAPFSDYAPRPYPTSYAYPTGGAQVGGGQPYQPPFNWSTSNQQSNTFQPQHGPSGYEGTDFRRVRTSSSEIQFAPAAQAPTQISNMNLKIRNE
ncbi:hypothetical protein B0H34DRAFT_227530 [Crassisporium funariophilum]|nr:hypothetical protein B0H34DRAFT_227530 [Crassisporium funariophilum]